MKFLVFILLTISSSATLAHKCSSLLSRDAIVENISLRGLINMGLPGSFISELSMKRKLLTTKTRSLHLGEQEKLIQFILSFDQKVREIPLFDEIFREEPHLKSSALLGHITASFKRSEFANTPKQAILYGIQDFLDESGNFNAD